MKQTPSQSRKPGVAFPYWLALALSTAAILACGAYYYHRFEFPKLQEETSVLSNLGVLLLINLNIVLMMVLGFLVVRNVIRLFRERRQNILGSRLRSRLVGAFVGLSLVPTVLLFLVSKGILETVFQEWFSPQIATLVDGSLEVAGFVYDYEEGRVYRHVQHLADEISGIYPELLGRLAERAPLDVRERQALEKYLESEVREYGLFELALVDRAGKVIVSSHREPTEDLHVPDAAPNAVVEALAGTTIVRPEQSLNGEFLRGYSPINISPVKGLLSRAGEPIMFSGTENRSVQPVVPRAQIAVVATVWLSPELNEVLSTIIGSYDDYKELGTYRRPLASSYILTLVAFTLLIIFAAVWVGFYLAKGLSGPIQQLAEGTEEVAQGNLEYRIAEVGDDELNIVVRSFNKMTEDLKETTTELVSRRRYMETVLESVGVGVVSLDSNEQITTANAAWLDMFQIRQFRERQIRTVFPKHIADSIGQLLDELATGEEHAGTTNVLLEEGSVTKQIQVKATKLIGDNGETLGAVLLFEDLTELVNAQRMTAWREVARRIAHEIKNPLTPIQLSAQRLQRKFAVGAQSAEANSFTDRRDREIIKQCSDTIIRQVETLRSLVNEFTRFARMPKINPSASQLNTLLNETIAMYREFEPSIKFLSDLDPDLPELELDRQQLSRVMVNLLDNAIFSVLEKQRADESEGNQHLQAVFGKSKLLERITGFYERHFHAGVGGFKPRININSSFNVALGLVTVSVADNGQGVKDLDKSKLFEPYFSTKKGGTGLGLSIVNAIVADHNGFIRVRDNDQGGATFVIELPVTRPRKEEARKEEARKEEARKEERRMEKAG